MFFMHYSGDPMGWWDTVCPAHWREVKKRSL